MNTKLTCPVCDRPEIEGEICPNCETDLSLIRMLLELPPASVAIAKPGDSEQKVTAAWFTPALVLLILFLGVALGVAGNVLSTSLSQNSDSTPTAIVVPNPVTALLPPCRTGVLYTVKSGDSLSLIAEREYDNFRLESLIAEANPTLKDRPNFLVKTGEVLFIPKDEEACFGNF